MKSANAVGKNGADRLAQCKVAISLQFVKMHYLQTTIKPGMSVCPGFPLKYSSIKGKQKHTGQAKMK